MSWNLIKMLLKPWQNIGGIEPEPEVDLSLKVCIIACGNCELYGDEWTDKKGKRGFCDMIY